MDNALNHINNMLFQNDFLCARKEKAVAKK